jgi:hypothetical protein
VTVFGTTLELEEKVAQMESDERSPGHPGHKSASCHTSPTQKTLEVYTVIPKPEASPPAVALTCGQPQSENIKWEISEINNA